MRTLSAAFLLLVAAGTTSAAEGAPDTRKAIDRGLKFLADDAVAWKEDRKCASCHHAPMAIWALGEAKARGYAIDTKALTDLTAWVLAPDDPAKVNPKQPARPEVIVNLTPLMLALGFEAGDKASRAGLKPMLEILLKEQDKDGAWRLLYVWEPYNSTADVITTLALLTLTNPNAPDLGADGKAAREKGLKFLASAKLSDTPQAEALRLLLGIRLDRPATEREALAKSLAARQNADGGWGQAKGEKSDAYSTGQSLYALAAAGVKPSDPTLVKGAGYLVKSQKEDGSWAMASRPGGPGGKAAKNTAPIAFVGSAWAVMGLIRSSPAPTK